MKKTTLFVLFVLLATATVLLVAAPVEAGRTMACDPDEPCAPGAPAPEPEPEDLGLGPCYGHGGIVAIESVQAGPYLIFHHVVCQDGHIETIAEDGILSQWNDVNQPSPDSFPEPGLYEYNYDTGAFDEYSGC